MYALDANTMQRYKEHRQQQQQQQQEVCAICLENLKYNNRNIHETKCGHKFHALCFRQLPGGILLSCPCCRQEVEQEPVRQIQQLKQNHARLSAQEQDAIYQIRAVDLSINENRIQHLRNLLDRELKENHRLKTVIRNTRLYHKIKKTEIKNRIRILRVDLKSNAIIKKHLREQRRRPKPVQPMIPIDIKEQEYDATPIPEQNVIEAVPWSIDRVPMSVDDIATVTEMETEIDNFMNHHEIIEIDDLILPMDLTEEFTEEYYQHIFDNEL